MTLEPQLFFSRLNYFNQHKVEVARLPRLLHLDIIVFKDSEQ